MSWAWLWIGLLMLGWFLHVRYLSREVHHKKEAVISSQNKLKKINASLATKTHRVDHLLSAIEEAILRVDKSGRVMAANAKGMRLFGIHDASALPQSMVLFYRNPDWLNAFHKAVKSLPDAAELPEIFIDGKVLLPRLAGLEEGQGLLLCLDITEQYNLQEQRKTFVSNLMHDLKTPLTSLLGYARSMESFADDAALRQEAAQVIAQEAKHVNNLLEGLLTVEQIEYGGAGDAHCDMPSVLQQVWQTLQPEMAMKDVRVHGEVPDMLRIAMQESDCLRVLMNVASNAVRYTADGSKIHCVWDGESLRIEDEGEGIPEKDLPHVTERFYCVDGSRAGSGHGLGLAIVKETLERDGGCLTLENREPKGLCVRIRLPVLDL